MFPFSRGVLEEEELTTRHSEIFQTAYIAYHGGCYECPVRVILEAGPHSSSCTVQLLHTSQNTLSYPWVRSAVEKTIALDTWTCIPWCFSKQATAAAAATDDGNGNDDNNQHHP